MFFKLIKVFFTLKDLSIRPGDALKEFLHGKRKIHFKPIAYLLTLSTVYFLITRIINQNTIINNIIAGFLSGAIRQGSAVEISKITSWLSESYAYLTLILLPVFSVASYISFFNSGKNYFEHIVINSYTTGHQAIFYSLFAMAGKVIDNYIMEIFSFLAVVSYTFWVFWQFFKEGSRMINILRSIMTYVLYLIFSLVFLTALMRMIEL